ncbi:MAG: threonine synthase [Muribaculaceae bacterium]|nr:threonine synthase [Muribaculaceae bacterium]
MQFYSTRHKSPDVTLEHAVFKGLAEDGGLYMPRTIPRLPQAFIANLKAMSLHDIAYAIANYAFQGDVEASVLHQLVNDTLNYDIPVCHIDGDKYVMELFHGPTMAYKDVGAQFMGGLLKHYMTRMGIDKTVNILVPTSGDTGGAVAGGFHNVPGVKVWVLYPQDSISYMQEAQFASLGGNVQAVEVNGTFDDCKRLVEQAFMDADLNRQMMLTSATSINVARIVPQTIYYFWAYASLMRMGKKADNLVFSVPCANLGNLVSGLVAQQMGLPVKRFVAVENENSIFYNYMNTGVFKPRPSAGSIAPALDVGHPTNFERIVDITGSVENARKCIHAMAYTDQQIIDTMNSVYSQYGYILDPHSAFAYRGLCDDIQPGETGVSLATAHPAKFSTQVEMAIGHEIEVPAQLRSFLSGTRQVVSISSGYTSFKQLLLE